MKLYTKHQLIITAIVSVFSALLIAAGFTALSAKNSGTANTSAAEKTTSDIVTEAADQAQTQFSVPSDETSFQLETNARTSAVNVSNELLQYTADEMQNISVYEKCNEAVVNINTQVMAINWFLEPVPQEGGSGSGSIIDTRGYVLTNKHVINNAYKIYISLSDGTQYEGKVIGTDDANDIAVLKFDPPNGVQLTTISFSDSAKLKVGQKVIAIGNPFGLERTMTTGIVSGLGRPIQSSTNTIIRNMIQTDTAINPGNSGGPLLDTQGRMIGINTMIYSTSGSSAGVGFAVPVDTAKRVVSDILQHGKVRRGVIQAKFVQLNAAIAQYANMSISRGLLVSEIVRGGNADKAGFVVGTEAVQYGSRLNPQIIYLGGDVITAIDSIKVGSFADYYSALESKKPGDSVTVTLQRGRHTVEVKVQLSDSGE